MEFNFSVNALFRERIIKVKNNLLPDTHTSDRHGDGDVVSKMSEILDKMGIESSKAQNLPRTITSATKLRTSDHVVYFLANPQGNKGHGTVVGLLKVGRKKLFVYDQAGNQMEIEPLCVLDFYIHESQQRTGCGHFLFEHMLQDQQVGPQHLALDQPSESFLKFMNKHYALDTIMPQNNGFVVYDTFFKDRAGSESIRAPKQANLTKNAHNPVHSIKTTSRMGSEQPIFGRHSAMKPGSTMAQYMQDGGSPHVNGKNCGSPWSVNHRVPLAQYGQYWSSIGQLLEEQTDDEMDGAPNDTVHHRVRKISNVPIGQSGKQDDDEFDADADFIPNGFNGSIGSTRDVRFKKTSFQNLSPFRR